MILNIDNKVTTTFEVSLGGTKQPVVHQFTWKFLPTIKLAMGKGSNQPIKGHKLKLILTSDKDLSQETLKAIQIRYTQDQMAGMIKLGQEDIQGKDLYTLLGNRVLDANTPIALDLELEGFNPATKKGITKLTISLEGPVEPISLEIQKLGK